MAIIALEGMEFFAHHGYYDEEQIVGGTYLVDVSIDTEISKAANSDELSDTINYETVYLIVEAEMRKPSKLLEDITHRILNSLMHQFSSMQAVEIKISKLQPPLGGKVAKAYIGEEKNFVQSCGRCKKPLICYNSEACWCNEQTAIHPKTLDTLKHQFDGKCLCKNCLAYYAG